MINFFSAPPNVISRLDVGDSTIDLGGDGQWEVERKETLEGELNFYWIAPQINHMVGQQSEAGQWVWDGAAWTVHPDYATPDLPVAPVGTVNDIKAVNHHATQTPGQGKAYYPRTRFPGQNAGWQAGTVGDVISNYSNAEVFLFKDDLVWRTIYKSEDPPRS